MQLIENGSRLCITVSIITVAYIFGMDANWLDIADIGSIGGAIGVLGVTIKSVPSLESRKLFKKYHNTLTTLECIATSVGTGVLIYGLWHSDSEITLLGGVLIAMAYLSHDITIESSELSTTSRLLKIGVFVLCTVVLNFLIHTAEEIDSTVRNISSIESAIDDLTDDIDSADNSYQIQDISEKLDTIYYRVMGN